MCPAHMLDDSAREVFGLIPYGAIKIFSIQIKICHELVELGVLE
jgi:hypothetical protein